MKQHITVEQLNEVSENGKNILRKWWKPAVGDMVYWNDIYGPLTKNGEGYWDDMENSDFNKNDYSPLLSIGQMVEFLDEYLFQKKDDWSIHVGKGGYMFVTAKETIKRQPKEGLEIKLCDALWKAVKEVLTIDAPNGLDGSQGA
jgi:hypothetical protein